MLDFRSKTVVIVGLGASGVAAAELALARGARVIATDSKARGALSPAVIALEAKGAGLRVAGHDGVPFSSADCIVVSPGVPEFAALKEADKKGIPIWGEVEFAVLALKHPAPIISVGGTNGKSTTTTLIGELLQACGLRTFVGGNLGEPLAAHADEAFDAIVLEVSSFQMERIDSFHPRVSILLNVTADHLDRYPDFAAYAHAKGNSFVRQTEGDLAVVPEGDPICLAEARRGRGSIVTFGPAGTIQVTPEFVIDTRSGEKFERAKFRLSGGHNALNVAASIAAVSPFKVPADTIREVLARFRGLAHRTELVLEIAGVRYYDDSKGTNVGASVTALLGLVEDKAVLIAGGRDKQGSYAPLASALAEKGRAVVTIGEAGPKIAEAVGPILPTKHAETLDAAVRMAAELAQPGDAVLLSPACSSFDMFRDYKHRGEEFVRAVHALQSGRQEP